MLEDPKHQDDKLVKGTNQIKIKIKAGNVEEPIAISVIDVNLSDDDQLEIAKNKLKHKTPTGFDTDHDWDAVLRKIQSRITNKNVKVNFKEDAKTDNLKVTDTQVVLTLELDGVVPLEQIIRFDKVKLADADLVKKAKKEVTKTITGLDTQNDILIVVKDNIKKLVGDRDFKRLDITLVVVS